MTVEWRDIPGHDGYQVSSAGQVRSIDRVVTTPVGRWGGPVKRWVPGRVLSPNVKDSGHLFVQLPGQRYRQVHHLVLEAFVGPRPLGMECCHNNGDPADNRVENLRWDTRAENRRDSVRHGTHPLASRVSCPQGHPLTMPKLVASQIVRGNRSCLACNRAQAQAQRDKKRGLAMCAERYRELADAKYAEITRKSAALKEAVNGG